MSKLDAINTEELLQRENIVVAHSFAVADWQRFVALAPMDFFSTSLGHTTLAVASAPACFVMFIEEALKNGSHLRSHVINHEGRQEGGILRPKNKIKMSSIIGWLKKKQYH